MARLQRAGRSARALPEPGGTAATGPAATQSVIVSMPVSLMIDQQPPHRHRAATSTGNDVVVP